jgi:hypothetical protein
LSSNKEAGKDRWMIHSALAESRFK